jgi:hypothetical protein
MKAQTPIAAALAELEQSTCSIVTVRATGKKIGTLKLIERCTRAMSVANGTSKKPSNSIAQPFRVGVSMAESGIITLLNIDTNEYMTILISHIIYINNKKIIH